MMIDDIAIEDVWVKIFSFHVGCPCPSERIKERFIAFAKENLKEDSQEQDIYDLFPIFINYLGEW
jgi:hypothetical protein